LLQCGIVTIDEAPHAQQASGVASPKIWERPKKLGGGAKCLILGEKHYFVWKNASQSTK